MITTRRGDDGETDICFGKRISKVHPIVRAVGAVDQLQVSLGVARVNMTISGYAPRTVTTRSFSAFLRVVQGRLIHLMGEVSTLPEDWDKYDEKFESLGQADLDRLDAAVAALDPHLNREQRTWSIPGDHPHTIGLEQARVSCREAEREVFSLAKFWKKTEAEPVPHHRFSITFKYLNRLSDILWMMARVVESNATVILQYDLPADPPDDGPE